MATVLRSDSRRLYSWWWDSHISPKNSKWLQENLTDMDAKVKAMIKLIEEDADSFARRAEMYYKKRPELMKLVEEFYRAYRALAERYNNATGELRHAHQTMAKAFPDQVPYDLAVDSPSASSCPETEPNMPNMHALLDPNDLQKDSLGLSAKDLHAIKRKGGYSKDSNHGNSKKTGVLSESERALNAETEAETLKRALAEILAEKEAMFIEFQQNLEKLSNLERRVDLDKESNRAEVELLKEAIAKLEAQRDDVHLQHKQCIERLSSLETMLSVAQEDAKELKERANKAEVEAQNLRQELSKVEAEKEAGEAQYDQCLVKISLLANKISLTEEEAGMLKQQAERADMEVKSLKEALAKVNEEKEAMSLKYKQCLEKIAETENDFLRAKEDAEQLKRDVLVGAEKLKNADERCGQLDFSNHTLKSEAESLARDIAVKDQELSKKHDELEKLKVFAQEEQSRFMQIEATLQNLQKLQSQSQHEQRAMALDFKNGIQMLRDMESNRHGLEDVIQRVTEENRSLNEQNSSSANTIQNLESEIASLKGIKKKLEEEFSLQAEASNVLHQEIFRLKEEIKDLNMRYQGLVAQLESVGITPGCLLSTFKGLQDENSKLKEICQKDMGEREVLYEQLKAMDKLLEENACLGFSLSDVNVMLEGSREKVKELQESCLSLEGEKSGMVAEKATLLSQLQIITKNMQTLLERNTLLETSLSGANSELEGLRVKSKYLEEFCQLLTHEKSNLLNERTAMASQLASVEERLRILENRFTKLEEKYAGLEMEKQTRSCEVQELQSYLTMEKRERENYMQSNQIQLAGLENHVQLLQQESRLSKKEFEEQLDKAVNAQVEIFVLQKFIKDLEEKNLSIRTECQKHVEASKLSGKLISELETENLEQQVEVEFLLDEIEKLRLGIHQVLRALQMDPDSGHENWMEQEQVPLSRILDNIEGLKSSLVSNHDDKHQLLIENSVLLTLLEQQKLDGSELVSENSILEQEFDFMSEQCKMLQKDKYELLEMNRQLRLELSKGEQQEADLKAEMESLCVKLVDMERAYQMVHDEYSMVLVENSCLVKKFSDLTEEMHVLEEENVGVLQETVALSNLSLVFKNFGDEKVAELKALTDDLNHLHAINSDLTEEVKVLGQRLDVKEAENLHLSESAKKLDKELDYVGELNGNANHELSVVKDFLRQKETEFSDAVQKLEATKNLNMELCRTIEELKKECEKSKLMEEIAENKITELSEDNTNQKKEIEHLRQLNGNLESEVDILCKEIEECRVREENLSTELQERSNEFEMWEAEAATFYFDMQISSVREVLLEDKIQELTGVCGNLQEESISKGVEIEHMKGRVSFLETEIGGLKAKLSAYAPAIASLRDDIASLEHNALHSTNFSVSGSQQKKDTGVAIHPAEISGRELKKDQCALTPDGISDLLKIRARIRAVEKAVVEEKERLAMQKSSSRNMIVEGAVKETEDSKSECAANQEKVILKEKAGVGVQLSCKTKAKKTQPKIPETRDGLLTKDIVLDQVSNGSLYGISRRRNRRSGDHMLELWESGDQDPGLDPEVNGTKKLASVSWRKSRSSSPEFQDEKELSVDKLEVLTSSIELYEERNKKKILERLASDAKKLVSLQITLLDFKKIMNKKDKYNEYGTVRLQLHQVEEAVMELMDFNHQLTKTIEERPSTFNGKNLAESEETRNIHLNRLAEQARRGSEKIGRLQFEVQSIQYILLKLGDEKKIRGKNKFPVSKASVFLRIFLLSARRRKSRFCGCMRPSTN